MTKYDELFVLLEKRFPSPKYTIDMWVCEDDSMASFKVIKKMDDGNRGYIEHCVGDISLLDGLELATFAICMEGFFNAGFKRLQKDRDDAVDMKSKRA